MTTMRRQANASSLSRRPLPAGHRRTLLESVRRRPALERRAFRAARRYVAGTSCADTVDVVRRLQKDGLGASIDLFGESVTDTEAVERTVRSYLEVARAIGELDADAYLEVVPSHLGLDSASDLLRRNIERIVEVRAVQAALDIGATSSDAIALFVHHRKERPVSLFSLDGHPHLRPYRIEAPDLLAYASLKGASA